MRNSNTIIIILFIISLIISCSAKKFFSHEKYIVLDKQGLSFTVYSSLEYEQKPSKDKLNTNSEEAKSITRAELGKYDIIEPSISKRDSIWKHVAIKVNKSLSQENHFIAFKIDSIYIDEWIKKTIVSKFGERYRFK